MKVEYSNYSVAELCYVPRSLIKCNSGVGASRSRGIQAITLKPPLQKYRGY